MKQAAGMLLALGLGSGCLLKPFAVSTNSNVAGQLQNILDPSEHGTARARGRKARVRAECESGQKRKGPFLAFSSSFRYLRNAVAKKRRFLLLSSRHHLKSSSKQTAGVALDRCTIDKSLNGLIIIYIYLSSIFFILFKYDSRLRCPARRTSFYGRRPATIHSNWPHEEVSSEFLPSATPSGSAPARVLSSSRLYATGARIALSSRSF